MLQSSYTKLCLDTNGAENGKELMQTDCKPSADNQNFQCDLVVRTMKRRRANMCLTAGRSSAWFPYNRLWRRDRLCRPQLRTSDREQLRRFLHCSVSIIVSVVIVCEGTGSYSTQRHVLTTKKCIVGYLCIASVVRDDRVASDVTIVWNIERVFPYNCSDRLTVKKFWFYNIVLLNLL